MWIFSILMLLNLVRVNMVANTNLNRNLKKKKTPLENMKKFAAKTDTAEYEMIFGFI